MIVRRAENQLSVHAILYSFRVLHLDDPTLDTEKIYEAPVIYKQDINNQSKRGLIVRFTSGQIRNNAFLNADVQEA